MISLCWDGDWPVTQLFGEEADFYSSLGMKGHNGLDVGMPEGTDLTSPATATVAEVGWDATGYGHYVKLRTFAGGDILYAHMMEPTPLAEGDYVDAYQRIGHSGATGHATGPHLHLAWRPSHEYRGGGYLGYADPLLVIGAP